MKWKELPVPNIGDDYDGHFRAHRLNSLGSLFYFTKYTLGKHRLTTFHQQLCRSLEAEDFHLVLEVPMGMFKTTLGIALSIWWALPMSIEDEREFEKLGYKKAWLRYMRAVHNPNTRTLTAHEIDGRAVDMGKEVDDVYFHNDLFRQLFATILPDKECQWNDHRKYQRRDRDLPADATNPTYAYCGVGHALQGVRADNTIEDDCYGRAAQDSLLKSDNRVGESTIRWHRQLTNRMDTAVEEHRKYRQLVIGNRWSHADLNSFIRKKQPQFTFESHDAEGGCCNLHPKHGVPIFPEEFSMAVLAQKQIDNTPYDYAHFFRNKATLPEEQVFDAAWLRKFKYKKSNPELPESDLRNILLIEHSTYEGTVVDDIQPGALDIVILVDPNHAKKVKRSRHVIWSIGFDSESARIYLLNLWAEESTYSVLVEEMYRERHRWTGSLSGPPPVYMGALAHKLLSFYLAQRDKREKNHLEVNEFEDDASLAAMKNRIESLEPTFKNRQIWHHPSQKEFVEAVENYPACVLDTLDVLGFYPTIVEVSSSKEDDEFLAKQNERFASRNSGAGGY
jgi:hypothetical protein